jgi:hypothetical protein
MVSGDKAGIEVTPPMMRGTQYMPCISSCSTHRQPNDDMPLRCCSGDRSAQPRLSRFSTSQMAGGVFSRVKTAKGRPWDCPRGHSQSPVLVSPGPATCAGVKHAWGLGIAFQQVAAAALHCGVPAGAAAAGRGPIRTD